MTAVIYTDAGEAFVVDRFDNTTTATLAWIGWGTGGSSTGATGTKTSTGLSVSATEAWVLSTQSQPAADTNQFVATITAGTGKTVEEAGVFCGTATGSAAIAMLIRANHGGQTLATGDSIQYTFTLQQT